MKLYICAILAVLIVGVTSRATILSFDLEYRPSRLTMLIDLLIAFVLIVWGITVLHA